jgi:poly(A) polymerase
MPARVFATNIVKKLVDKGYIAYFAGGWVRDFLMQRPSDDIDIATNASVEVIQSLFSKTVPVGVAFGIVLVIENHHSFEVATFRKDRGYVDGRRPVGIDPASPREDAQRRDFTINGMFYDPLRQELHDFVGGQIDLKKGIIRAIGNPHERFLEDRLRMMRAVRYSTRFDFPIESETLQAILSHATSLLPAVAMERIWQEFKKMSQFAHFDAGLVTLHRLNLLPTIFPSLKGVPIEEIQHRLRSIPAFPKNAPAIAELLDLFPTESLDELQQLCDYLKLSNQERSFVTFYHHANNLLNMPKSWQKDLELVEWAHLYAHEHAAMCLQLFAAHLATEAEREDFLKEHQLREQHLKPAIERIQSQNPVVRAEDLMAAGIFPGKKMGELLREAERIAINRGIEDRTAVLALLKQSPLWRSRD